MSKKNIRLDIQYDGGEFSGWQFQPNARTVQGEIEKAIEKVTGQKISIYAAGRTDAGVHALGQVANFYIEHHIQPEKYKDAINYYLPQTILISKAVEVEQNFHARKSAHWRYYRYIIGRNRSALYYNRRWEYTCRLDIERMNEIAEYIKGLFDFSAFCTVASQKENNECNILESMWRKEEDRYIYEIKGNRFLHTMVRSLVGSMVEAGKETKPSEFLTLNKFKLLLQSKDHTRLKTVAPPQGLYLVAVGY
jgi:tRNA pseudouridine38-40 synthase